MDSFRYVLAKRTCPAPTVTSESDPKRTVQKSDGSLLRGGFPPRRRSDAADLGIPRAREATAPGLLTGEHVVVDRPLGARHLVEHLDAVAVRVAQVDAERDAVVDDAFD